MEHVELQLLGGVLYLLNKYFLFLMEECGSRNQDSFWFWKKWAWGVYLLGLPPWLAFFFWEQNWIFFCIEAGGVPAMLCGYINAWSREDAPRWLEKLAVVAVPIGIVFSLWDFGLSRWPTQILETAGSAGFLVGTYLIYKGKLVGYKWFAVMNIATGILVGIQGYWLLCIMQAASVILVVMAYRAKKKRITHEPCVV